jgi:hypothetical protein
MIITETHNHQDGSKSTREIQIPFQKGKSRVAFSLVPETDEPIAIFVLQAGWIDGGPTFHILTEYGDMMQTDVEYCTLSQAYEKYPEFQPIWESSFQDTVVSVEDLLTNPNDQELGKLIRLRSLPF